MDTGKENLVDNVADPKQVKQGKKERRRKEQEHVLNLRKVLSFSEGRRLLWHYISMCNVLASIVGSKPEETYYNEGMRVVGTTIFNDWREISPDTLVQMMVENQKLAQLAKGEPAKEEEGEEEEEE